MSIVRFSLAPDFRQLVVLMMAAGFAAASQPSKAQCQCGPTYCQGTPEYRSALVKKKADAAQQYPPRLVTLYDNLDKCEAAVTTAPDGFSVLIVKRDNSILVQEWGSERERNGADEKRRGILKECRVLLARRAFECCGAKKYSDRPDYDATLDYNRSNSVPCQG